MDDNLHSEGEEYLLSSLSAILSPLGICRLVYGPGSHVNKDKESASKFHLLCGSFDSTTRDKEITKLRCCGFKICLLLNNAKFSGDVPHLEVREFCSPETSKHLRVSSQAREKSKSSHKARAAKATLSQLPNCSWVWLRSAEDDINQANTNNRKRKAKK